MQIDNQIFAIKNQINAELENFFELKIKKAESSGNQKEIVDVAKNLKLYILNSGKRMRPILFYFGYILAGGQKKSDALKASISIELIHSYLLIHDDIIDRDAFRHGIHSMHQKYMKDYREKYENRNAKHYGNSMAILVGDFASAFGYEVLTNSQFSDSLKIKAINKLNQIDSNTLIGQALDVKLVRFVDVKEEQIIEMQKFKTAKYTIEGPLQLGAILASADEKFLNQISEFAIPVGIAFQIKDDIIGVFGDKKKIGKPTGSDLKEGKKTLLISKALENAQEKDKKFLIDTLGSEDINFEKIKRVREIIINTGSLKYSEDKAAKLIVIAKNKLDLLNVSDEKKFFLFDLFDFIVKRNH
ncbi:polyprenyl synthetase family protein [Patescibacteria group bacterium]|nr:polyprenyl synthetase family protein [Patescibacteria group bacterium]